jgi:uncharacterized damage-inducible protein DinB
MATTKKKVAKKSAIKKEKVVEVEPAQAPAPKPARGRGKAPVDLQAALLHAFATNERINQYLLEHLDAAAWNAPPPSGKGRQIAAIVSHMHNVRHMWLVVAAKDYPAPEKLDRKTVTLEAARAALAESSTAMRELLRRSCEGGGHVFNFKPDVVGFLGYVIAHEAHHRGQIALLARELGFALPQGVGYGMWEWGKRGQEVPATPAE